MFAVSSGVYLFVQACSVHERVAKAGTNKILAMFCIASCLFSTIDCASSHFEAHLKTSDRNIFYGAVMTLKINDCLSPLKWFISPASSQTV